MIAEVERRDRTFEYREMGEPECGEDFCDYCGDCLVCFAHDPEDWCPTGMRWVIYLDDPHGKNPHTVESSW